MCLYWQTCPGHGAQNSACLKLYPLKLPDTPHCKSACPVSIFTRLSYVNSACHVSISSTQLLYVNCTCRVSIFITQLSYVNSACQVSISSTQLLYVNSTCWVSIFITWLPYVNSACWVSISSTQLSYVNSACQLPVFSTHLLQGTIVLVPVTYHFQHPSRQLLWVPVLFFPSFRFVSVHGSFVVLHPEYRPVVRCLTINLYFWHPIWDHGRTQIQSGTDCLNRNGTQIWSGSRRGVNCTINTACSRLKDAPNFPTTWHPKLIRHCFSIICKENHVIT